jgi:hypothetical protein
MNILGVIYASLFKWINLGFCSKDYINPLSYYANELSIVFMFFVLKLILFKRFFWLAAGCKIGSCNLKFYSKNSGFSVLE